MFFFFSNRLGCLWIRTFAIITVPTNDIVATVHDRMPAILDKENFSRCSAMRRIREACFCPIRQMRSL
jgi:hypothetical protein